MDITWLGVVFVRVMQAQVFNYSPLFQMTINYAFDLYCDYVNNPWDNVYVNQPWDNE